MNINSVLKICLLLCIVGLLAGGFIIGPLTHQSSSYEIEFTDEDRALFKKNQLETDEQRRSDPRGYKEWEYFVEQYNILGSDEYNKRLIKKIESRNCIPFYFGHKEDFRDWHHFEKAKEGERKGKVSCQYFDKPFEDAVNRTLDKYCYHNFSGGFIMKNSALDRIGVDNSYLISPEGYSIVTGGWEKIEHCLKRAEFLSFVGFLIPILVAVSVLIIRKIICKLAPQVWRWFIRYLKWTFMGLFKT